MGLGRIVDKNTDSAGESCAGGLGNHVRVLDSSGYVVLYAHLAQVVSRDERAPVMSLTPVPRNLAQFSLPLLAAAAANVSTAAALAVGAVAYAAAGWVGWLLARSTPPPEVAEAEDKERGR